MLIEKKVGNLSFAADENGAELHSLKYKGEEFLWQCGDAWKRYAPVLFPFICSPKDRTYRAGGKEYTMPGNHGFARDSKFKLVGDSESSATFCLESSAATKEWYPYDFKLLVSYIINNGVLEVRSTVQNAGKEDMYFYLGGHPAFICDIEGGESVAVYEKPETIIQPIPEGERTVLDGKTTLHLTREMFKYDVIMKDHPASKAITLKKEDGGYVKLSFPNSECIAVWTAADPAAQFICLEPWTSVPAYADDEYANIEEKPHAIKLSPESAYIYKYFIEIGKI